MSSILVTKNARRSVVAGAVLIGMASGLVSHSPAHAALPNKHDGRWSIEVITEKGDCDRAYRYSVLVENGAARYAGSEPITVSGRVASNGAVNGSRRFMRSTRASWRGTSTCTCMPHTTLR